MYLNKQKRSQYYRENNWGQFGILCLLLAYLTKKWQRFYELTVFKVIFEPQTFSVLLALKCLKIGLEIKKLFFKSIVKIALALVLNSKLLLTRYCFKNILVVDEDGLH